MEWTDLTADVRLCNIDLVSGVQVDACLYCSMDRVGTRVSLLTKLYSAWLESS